MATTFNMLRANDLIWSFVVNNYLLGKEPFPFDLLYWNSDSTRMPAAMHSFYLRNMYQENRLVSPAASRWPACRSTSAGSRCRAYLLSTREDHIAPWRVTYAATQIYNGPVQVRARRLGPHRRRGQPARAAANTAIGKAPSCRRAPTTGSRAPSITKDSWWPTWEKWISKYAGGEVPARQPGDCKLAIIEDAPGSYVRVKAS